MGGGPSKHHTKDSKPHGRHANLASKRPLYLQNAQPRTPSVTGFFEEKERRELEQTAFVEAMEAKGWLIGVAFTKELGLDFGVNDATLISTRRVVVLRREKINFFKCRRKDQQKIAEDLRRWHAVQLLATMR